MASPAIPFWGPQTSYLNFCEEDYVITRFVAEFINTFSSLIYILFGIYGLVQVRQKKNAALRRVSYCGLIGVGVCSGGYHMTLKYHTQMSDELSMHLLTTPLLYRILTFQATPERTKLIGAILLTMFTVVMVVHMVMDEFLLHAVAFGLAVWLIARGTIRMIPNQIPDPLYRKKIQRLSFFGCSCFLFGYLVWLIDEFACAHLARIRLTVGLPLAFLFEFHGWWHVFTAIGGYIAVATVDLITSGEVHEDVTGSLAWPVPFMAKLVQPSPESKKHG